MAFSAAGITAHPEFTGPSDFLLDAAWHPDGTMWAFINRQSAGLYDHYLSVYHPDTDTWDARRLVVPNGAGANSPQTYSYQTGRVAINKNGVAIFVYATGTSGSGRTYYRIIQPDYTVGSATQFLDSTGGSIDGRFDGGSIGASIINDCTDFVIVHRDSAYAYPSLAAGEINSVTGAVANRRQIWDGGSIPGADSVTIYSRCADVNPISNVLCVVAEWTEQSSGTDRKHHLLYIEEGEAAHVFTTSSHLAHASGPIRYYSMRPEFIVDNIDEGAAHVIYQLNTVGSGSSGNTATAYVPVTDGAFGDESILFDAGANLGVTDKRTICIDGNGNVYLGFDNNSIPVYTDPAFGSPTTPAGNGMECLALVRDTTTVVDRLAVIRYPQSESNGAIFPKMRPTTDVLMCVWANGGAGSVYYNVDPVMPGFITEDESQAGLGECAGMAPSESDINHQLYVFDERVYQQDDDESFA